MLFKSLIERYKIYRWSRALQLPQHEARFTELYSPINGFTLSKQSRASSGDAFEYTYGEIVFKSFIALLSLAKPNQHTRFYDLGSGIGKAVVACTMVFEVEKAVGIELFANLHDAAEQQRQQLLKYPQYHQRTKKISFIVADFLKQDFSDANLVFINATGFIGPVWDKLQEKLRQTAPESIMITISKKLNANQFILQRTTPIEMSWGITTAHIYIHRIKHPNKALPDNTFL